MGSDPEPKHAVLHIDAEGTEVEADARGPEYPCFLEMQRGVVWICFQLRKSSIRENLDLWRQSAVADPEIWRGVVDHSTVDRPASWSLSARSASERSLPLSASASICWSQAAASKRANQSRKAFNSSALRF